MHVSHLTLHQFRSHAALEVSLQPGVTAFLGPNGQGKTNIVEAVDYLARLASHRVAFDAPLVAQGSEQALVRASVVKDGRTAVIFGFQNPAPIEDDLSLVEIWHRLGVRFMQLSYNNQSLLATGCYEAEDPGITRMGREVIREMNRVGLVIDMSHSAERSTLEAIELSSRPIGSMPSKSAKIAQAALSAAPAGSA